MHSTVNRDIAINTSIVLLGYMGCGKSTIGRLLAKDLALPFIDLDEYLVHKHGESISKLFITHGEIGFRKIEKTALHEILAHRKTSVLSLGGGTPCYADNMQSVVQKTPHTFYLSPASQMLCQRLFPERSNRPMISHIHSKKELLIFISKHIFERKQFYEQAKHHLDIRHESAQEVVEEILKKLG